MVNRIDEYGIIELLNSSASDDADGDDSSAVREGYDGRVTDRFLRAIQAQGDDACDDFSRSSSLSSAAAWSFGRDAGEMSGGTERGLSPRRQRSVDLADVGLDLERRTSHCDGSSSECEPAYSAWRSHECDVVDRSRAAHTTPTKRSANGQREQRSPQRNARLRATTRSNSARPGVSDPVSHHPSAHERDSTQPKAYSRRPESEPLPFQSDNAKEGGPDALLRSYRLRLRGQKNAIYDLEAHLEQANQDIERRDATIVNLKKHLRTARDKLASPALGVSTSCAPSPATRRAAQQRENELDAAVREKDEMIKVLKSKDRRSREITSQLRQRVLAERDANSSLQLQVTDAKGKEERLQQSIEELRHNNKAAEKQIKHNRKEHERLLQEHAQAKGQIQSLEAELREALNYASKLDSKLVALKHLSKELEHENTKLKEESNVSREKIAKLTGELAASSCRSTEKSWASRRQTREEQAPLRDYKNLEAMYERVYGKSQKKGPQKKQQEA